MLKTTADEAHADQDFRRYLAARVTSVAGSLVATVALPVLVYQLTGSAGWTSAIAVAEALPYLLFGLIAGAVADRADRRVLMLSADFASAALLATIPAAWALGMLTAPQVLVVGFCVQTLFVLFDAANFGALPTLVGKRLLTEAYSRVYGATTLTELVIPPLSGLLVAVATPAPLTAVNAVTALASGLLVRSIVRPLSTPVDTTTRRTATSMLADIRTGLSFLARHRVVRVLTLVGTTHSVASGAYVAMLVPWADHVLGVPPSGDWRIAVLFSGWGVGGLLASRIVPRLTRCYGGARLALGALPASLLCGCAVVLTTHWIAAAVTATAWGAAYSTVVINAITYRQQVCPDGLQSRINTTCRMLSWGIGMPTGAALAGAIAAAGASPRAGIAAGVLVLAIGVITAWCSPLRNEPRTATT
ncbi:MFS transporter [Saccharopolyspora spinosa]|uniref:Transmembrane secretion effector n=1 Tax=Saccharopolyspora spinosa TaxID=60894 RepID=A0A2N3Y5S6_SACSN|nr:MFS transporter [Saccharopolyspora spinosa]PKW18265.1 transmembrane secretion effector [Saccharopolyspora spinosa]